MNNLGVLCFLQWCWCFFFFVLDISTNSSTGCNTLNTRDTTTTLVICITLKYHRAISPRCSTGTLVFKITVAILSLKTSTLCWMRSIQKKTFQHLIKEPCTKHQTCQRLACFGIKGIVHFLSNSRGSSQYRVTLSRSMRTFLYNKMTVRVLLHLE